MSDCFEHCLGFECFIRHDRQITDDRGVLRKWLERNAARSIGFEFFEVKLEHPGGGVQLGEPGELWMQAPDVAEDVRPATQGGRLARMQERGRILRPPMDALDAQLRQQRLDDTFGVIEGLDPVFAQKAARRKRSGEQPADRSALADLILRPEYVADLERTDPGFTLPAVVSRGGEQARQQATAHLGRLRSHRIEEANAGARGGSEAGDPAVPIARYEAMAGHLVHALRGERLPHPLLHAPARQVRRGRQASLRLRGGNAIISRQPRDLLDEIDLACQVGPVRRRPAAIAPSAHRLDARRNAPNDLPDLRHRQSGTKQAVGPVAAYDDLDRRRRIGIRVHTARRDPSARDSGEQLRGPVRSVRYPAASKAPSTSNRPSMGRSCHGLGAARGR